MSLPGDIFRLKFLTFGLFALFATVGSISYQTGDYELLGRLAFFLSLTLVVAGLFATYASDAF
ncbi:hypothetical protein [Haladaptatus sp. DYSN1]|uniref:hypothetical protein n=1 Tax=unclassified Haladaptatus TaxID=2622732 RepID=UPI002405E00D|nr:hypothetical protein [Haladaptatus sp. DYSN1]